MKQIWTEKYRPKEIKDYVFRDESQKDMVSAWIKEGNIPHLLLSGSDQESCLRCCGTGRA